ncbi:predicted protein [Lichtheimia corymbifera JMRC:FSU:9682]|uniref:Uncharacterized protein n=1 Tax=Lichtheimia corymbifera JMRC:FSU:9682 TaxID=1263082 RepID=A0A068SAM2_9FUNG|nr:predicted protein [Lichtheimia corymbifera JMRC:FSU:9682]
MWKEVDNDIQGCNTEDLHIFGTSKFSTRSATPSTAMYPSSISLFSTCPKDPLYWLPDWIMETSDETTTQVDHDHAAFIKFHYQEMLMTSTDGNMDMVPRYHY